MRQHNQLSSLAPLTATTTASSSSSAVTPSVRFLSIRRMLDLGDVPSGSDDLGKTRIANTSKNCQIQAVIFDFHLLTTPPQPPTANTPLSLPQQQLSEPTTEGTTPRTTTPAPPATTPTAAEQQQQQQLQPDMKAVEQVASLLGVKLGEGHGHGGGEEHFSSTRTTKIANYDDELSLLTGGSTTGSTTSNTRLAATPTPTTTATTDANNTTRATSDLRSKYANKLAQRGHNNNKMSGAGGGGGVVPGIGIGGIDDFSTNARFMEPQDELRGKPPPPLPPRGDASDHFAARNHVLAMARAADRPTIAVNTVGHRWIAQTGTGSLLHYLTQRSMKICLVPKPLVSKDDSTSSAPVATTSPRLTKEEESVHEGARMDELTRQLKDVVFDVLVKDGRMGVATVILQNVLEQLKMNANLILVVSDRDDYLQAAKAVGMMTCRIRPTVNARRGNISAHYMVSSISEVRSVIDDMNGISFNAVLQQR